MRTVAVVAFDGVDLFDFSTPWEAFRSVRLADGSAPYRVRACATKPHVDAKLFTI